MGDQITDQALIERVQQGDKKAFDLLVLKYQNRIMKVLSRYLYDQSEVQDMAQEAFIKAFRKINQFKGDVTFGAWLKRIVINTCLDTIKAKKIEVEPIQEEMIGIADEDDDWGVSDETTVVEITSAISELPDSYRIVVRLFLLEGYDHKEISEILKITESASRTNLHRGKLKLKESLKHLRYGTGY